MRRTYEKEALAQGFRFILGLDEAGRGPLAGPVVAAAVCLNSFRFRNARINDSKKMTALAREAAFHEIFKRGHVGIGIVSEAAVDEINILNASHTAMDLAVMQLLRRLSTYTPPESVEVCDSQIKLLVDGNLFRTQLPYSYDTIVDGDARCLSIACASIIAKVYRDRVMTHYDRLFPQYGFKQHKGYATRLHRTALETHGPSRIHRRSFSLLAGNAVEEIELFD